MQYLTLLCWCWCAFFCILFAFIVLLCIPYCPHTIVICDVHALWWCGILWFFGVLGVCSSKVSYETVCTVFFPLLNGYHCLGLQCKSVTDLLVLYLTVNFWIFIVLSFVRHHRSSITNRAAWISRELFDVVSPNVTRTSIPTYSTATPDIISLTTSGQIIMKRLRKCHIGRLRVEFFENVLIEDNWMLCAYGG